jgi:alpha-ketoglutarate-dependent taurine dioxygenase
MRITNQNPTLGVELRDLDIATATKETAKTVASLLLRHLVVIIRDQNVSSADHVSFSAKFGRLEEFPARPGDPDSYDPDKMPWMKYIFRVANERSQGYTKVGLYWHTDGYFHAQPTAVSIMRPVDLPDRGGDTWFANMYQAYDMLAPDLRKKVDGLTAVSRSAPGARSGTGLFSGGPVEVVRHPLARPHPLTGRKALYLNLGSIASIEGLHWRETDDLLKQLTAHIETADCRYCHKWQSGDIVMWENGAAAHMATPPPEGSLRVMERTTVDGVEYFESDFWREAARAAAVVPSYEDQLAL